MKLTADGIRKVKAPYRPKAVLVLVDELGEVMSSSNYKLVNSIQNNLGSIARLGRAAACHLCLATQRPSSNVINADLKNNIQMGILLGDFDSGASTLIFDKDISHMSKPEIKGRGYIKTGKDIIEFQSYWTEKKRDFLPRGGDYEVKGDEKTLGKKSQNSSAGKRAEKPKKFQTSKDLAKSINGGKGKKSKGAEKGNNGEIAHEEPKIANQVEPNETMIPVSPLPSEPIVEAAPDMDLEVTAASKMAEAMREKKASMAEPKTPEEKVKRDLERFMNGEREKAGLKPLPESNDEIVSAVPMQQEPEKPKAPKISISAKSEKSASDKMQDASPKPAIRLKVSTNSNGVEPAARSEPAGSIKLNLNAGNKSSAASSGKIKLNRQHDSDAPKGVT